MKLETSKTLSDGIDGYSGVDKHTRAGKEKEDIPIL